MTAEERIELLQKQAATTSRDSDEINDLEYLFPAPVKINVGNRTYNLAAYPIKKLYLLFQANDALKTVDTTTEWLAETLGEKDTYHLMSNIDSIQLNEIVSLINKVNAPPSSSVQSNADEGKPFGVGFRWNVFMLMRDLHMSYDDIGELTIPQLVILRQCIREVDEARELDIEKRKAQASLAAQFGPRR